VAHFWAATAFGRPATTGKAPHRTQMPPVDVLTERLTRPRVMAAAASSLVMATTSAAAAACQTPSLAPTAGARTSTARPASTTAAPIAAAATSFSWASAPRPHAAPLVMAPSILPVVPAATRAHLIPSQKPVGGDPPDLATTTSLAIGTKQADSATALSPPRSRAPARGPPVSPSTTALLPKRSRLASKAAAADAPH
jgi:hypothetical protein